VIEMVEALGDGRSVLEHASLTDVGLRRANNQDTLAVALAGDETDWRRRGHLFMVADGMGAHAAGELASKMACESVPHTYRKLLDRAPADALRMAIVTANTSIHERGQANAEFQGMGTTCSVLVLLPNAALVAHVGDSRVYRLRGEKIEQLTFDHSLVWEMMAAGQMPRGELASFIPKNIITRSLGPRDDVQIDLEGPFPLEAGDTFLLCSDGLSGQIKDEELGAILSVLSPQESARALVDMANLRGGPDNITAVIVRVLAVPPDPAGEPDPVPSVETTSAPLSQALWVLMGLGLLVALLLAASGNLAAALVSGLMAAGAAVIALVHNLVRSMPPAPTDVSGPLGSGPHAEHTCRPTAERVAGLCQMAQQLREAAKDEHWTLDWGRFNTFGEKAQAALAAGDFTRAVREYALAISFMMSEIRRQPARRDPRDSSVLDL
jgi:protein phosphatase